MIISIQSCWTLSSI